jgi:hypothetical protein
MTINENQKIAALQRIKKKQWYCGIPVAIGFVASCISKFAGASFEIINLAISTGFYLSWGLMICHCISTKCPECNKRFYSLWDVIGFGNARKHSCCNCSFSIPVKKKPKSYPESTGDEWNQ